MTISKSYKISQLIFWLKMFYCTGGLMDGWTVIKSVLQFFSFQDMKTNGTVRTVPSAFSKMLINYFFLGLQLEKQFYLIKAKNLPRSEYFVSFWKLIFKIHNLLLKNNNGIFLLHGGPNPDFGFGPRKWSGPCRASLFVIW